MEQTEPVLNRVRFVQGWEQMQEVECLDVSDIIGIFRLRGVSARNSLVDGDVT